LRGSGACTDADARAAMAFSPPGTEADPAGAATREIKWLDEDLARAIAVAEQAGLQGYRIEISLDGTITILVGTPGDEATED
jgi:hypothetical protein